MPAIALGLSGFAAWMWVYFYIWDAILAGGL